VASWLFKCAGCDYFSSISPLWRALVFSQPGPFLFFATFFLDAAADTLFSPFLRWPSPPSQAISLPVPTHFFSCGERNSFPPFHRD